MSDHAKCPKCDRLVHASKARVGAEYGTGGRMLLFPSCPGCGTKLTTSDEVSLECTQHGRPYECRWCGPGSHAYAVDVVSPS